MAAKTETLAELEARVQKMYAEREAEAAAEAQRRQADREKWARDVLARTKSLDGELADQEPALAGKANDAAISGNLQGAWEGFVAYRAHRELRAWARIQAEQAASVLGTTAPLPMLRVIEQTFPEWLAAIQHTAVERAAADLIDSQDIVPPHPDEVS